MENNRISKTRKEIKNLTLLIKSALYAKIQDISEAVAAIRMQNTILLRFNKTTTHANKAAISADDISRVAVLFIFEKYAAQ